MLLYKNDRNGIKKTPVFFNSTSKDGPPHSIFSRDLPIWPVYGMSDHSHVRPFVSKYVKRQSIHWKNILSTVLELCLKGNQKAA